MTDRTFTPGSAASVPLAELLTALGAIITGCTFAVPTPV